MRVAVKNIVGEAAHEAAHDLEDNNTKDNNGTKNDKAIVGKEDEFEEISDEGDGEGCGHDGNYNEKE